MFGKQTVPNTVNNSEDPEEDITSLLAPPVTKSPTYPVPWDIQIWTRNPFFYLNILIFIFSIFTFIIHISWSFTLGIIASVVSVVLSLWLDLYIFSTFKLHTRFTLLQIIKIGVSALVFLTLLGVLLYFQIFATIAHFSASDPSWSTFPNECVDQPNTYNCIRVGSNITNEKTTTGQIAIPAYNTSFSNGQSAIQDAIHTYLTCQIISSQTQTNEVFIHYRCLTPILGYPDDLAIKIFCGKDSRLYLWIHSQSRLGVWDYNVNDARVRLLWNVLTSDLFSYNSTLSDGAICQNTNFL